jgi:hypothetical protein
MSLKVSSMVHIDRYRRLRQLETCAFAIGPLLKACHDEIYRILSRSKNTHNGKLRENVSRLLKLVDCMRFNQAEKVNKKDWDELEQILTASSYPPSDGPLESLPQIIALLDLMQVFPIEYFDKRERKALLACALLVGKHILCAVPARELIRFFTCIASCCGLVLAIITRGECDFVKVEALQIFLWLTLVYQALTPVFFTGRWKWILDVVLIDRRNLQRALNTGTFVVDGSRS